MKFQACKEVVREWDEEELNFNEMTSEMWSSVRGTLKAAQFGAVICLFFLRTTFPPRMKLMQVFDV
jgi:hypothetical protein